MNKKIQEMINLGYSARHIANELFLDFKLVQNIVKDNNYTFTKQNFSEDKIASIIELYKNGVSAKNLGIIYSIDKRRIFNWVKKEGSLRSLEESHRVHSINDHIFDIIDTQEKAYWLGFLYADVYNYEPKGAITLALREADIDHLNKFINFVGGDFRCVKKMDKTKSYSFTINSIYLSNKLKELGSPQAKSFIIKYPDWLSKELNFHFIRGIFDGDGCLTFRKNQKEYKWSIAGTKELCQSISNIFKEFNININYYYISKTENNTYELESSGNLKIEKICDLIYHNANIYMERKYKKFLTLKEFNNVRHNRKKINFSQIIEINNVNMNNQNINNLTLLEKENLIDPITDFFFKNGMQYPDDTDKVLREYNLLLKYNPDLNINEINNTSKLGNYICKYFCPTYFNSSFEDLLSCSSVFENKDLILKAVKNKLGLNKHVPSSLNISYQNLIDEMKDMRLCANISIFKPTIAKYIVLKYSNEGDIVGDYSCGFGARLLGAVSCGRKYIGTDPLTVPELQNMIEFFKFKDVKLIQMGSEFYRGEENSIDLYWSSPPYYNKEIYSKSLSQAYNKGEEYFHNVYWRKTLENVKYMLKTNKYFGVNIGNKNQIMLTIAKEYFGEVVEKICLLSNRYHFAGSQEKKEYIYMFKNNK